MKTKKTNSNYGFNTKVSAIEDNLGIKLGVRSNMKIGNYLKKLGYKSLADMLEK